jgi:hypothetical protein
MAKNSFPMTKTSRGVGPKLVGVLIMAAFVVFAVKDPTDAGHLLAGVLTMLGQALEALAASLQHASG